VTSLLERGRADGELRADVDPARADSILSSVYIATLYHWLFCPPDHIERRFELRGELRTRLGIVLDGLVPRAAGVRP
jgi:hypothetical protein